jgi:hypothetical protein
MLRKIVNVKVCIKGNMLVASGVTGCVPSQLKRKFTC